MNVPIYIAWRYLKSKKTHNIIHLITGISTAGIAVGAFALIVVLSVFNGFESLVVHLFNYFNPDILITAQHGKTFHLDSIPYQRIQKIPGVYYLNEVLEENALVKYRNKQFIVTMKGVQPDYYRANHLDSTIVDGSFQLEEGRINRAVLGSGIAYHLDVNLSDPTTPLIIYAPRKMVDSTENPLQAFNQESILPSGVFSVQQEYDTKYLFVPLRFARAMMEYQQEVSSLEISVDKKYDVQQIKKHLGEILGSEYSIKDKFQQQEVLYKIMISEKFAVFLILSFILLIAAFNIVGSLSMLTLDKRRDIKILSNLGASMATVKKIFLFEGLFMSLIGGGLGIFLGLILCVLQQVLGLVKIHSGKTTFVVSNYPVEIQFWDVFWVFTIVLCMGSLASWFTVRRISSRLFNEKLP